MSADKSPVWMSGHVVSSAQVAGSVRHIVIDRPHGQVAAPGSHIDVLVTLPSGAKDIRSYSVVESSADARLLTIAVFSAPGSRGGSVFMHGLEPGDELECTQPIQEFPLRLGAARYVLLAGGIGITALDAMGKLLSRLKLDYTLHYAGRTREQMAFLDELHQLHGDRLLVHASDVGERLSVDKLVEGIARAPEALETELYMCGPLRLMDDVRLAWERHELPVTSLRYETFGNSGRHPNVDFVVRVPQLGKQTVVRTDETIIEALAREGVDLMYDCRKGECGLCRVTIANVRGTVDHRDVFLSPRQKDGGTHLCACVSRVVGQDPSVDLTLP